MSLAEQFHLHIRDKVIHRTAHARCGIALNQGCSRANEISYYMLGYVTHGTLSAQCTPVQSRVEVGGVNIEEQSAMVIGCVPSQLGSSTRNLFGPKHHVVPEYLSISQVERVCFIPHLELTSRFTPRASLTTSQRRARFAFLLWRALLVIKDTFRFPRSW